MSPTHFDTSHIGDVHVQQALTYTHPVSCIHMWLEERCEHGIKFVLMSVSTVHVITISDALLCILQLHL